MALTLHDHPRINPGLGEVDVGFGNWAPSGSEALWDTFGGWTGELDIRGVNFRLLIGIVIDQGEEFNSFYDAGLYDEATYSAGGDGFLFFVPLFGRLEAITVDRGKQHFGDAFQAGVGSITLSNDDGIFNPQLGSIGFGGQSIRPGVAVQLQGSRTDAPEWTTLWTGTIQSLGDVYIDAAHRIVSQWQVIGFEGSWSVNAIPPLEDIDPASVGQLTSDRAQYIWDTLLGFDAGLIEVEPGTVTMQGSKFPGSRLDQWNQAAQAEGGAFYSKKNGLPVFRNREWLDDPSVKFTIGAPGSEVQVLAVNTSYDSVRVRNDIALTIAIPETDPPTDPIPPVRALGSESIALYGRRSFAQSGYQNEDVNDLLFLANQQLAFHQFDSLRVDAIEVWADNFTDDGVQHLLDVDIGDRILLTVQTAGTLDWAYTVECWVFGVTHMVTTDDWKVTLRLDDTDQSSPSTSGSFDTGFDAGYDVREV